jgi:glycosyltransferase involved in cell wall biosynthesis
MTDRLAAGPNVKPQENVRLSIVVPLFNEEESVDKLLARILEVARSFDFSYEIIFVDDGSSDGTWAIIERLQAGVPQLRAIKLRGNCGQTGAMVAGFDHSRGEVIVTLDGDLQNDPADIPLLLGKLEEGYDIVSGWRKDRQDHWSRVLPSRVANGLISLTTGVRLHDYGCSLKAYRAECVRSLDCYGEMHRFFPALASMTGARVAELPVSHHPRRFGVSKYGFNRIFKVFSDIFAINLIIRFSSSPLKGFALCALPFALLAGGFGTLALMAWWLDWTAGKALFFSVGSGLSFLGVALMVSLGTIGELAVGLSDLSHTRLIASTCRKSSVGTGENSVLQKGAA